MAAVAATRAAAEVAEAKEEFARTPEDLMAIGARKQLDQGIVYGTNAGRRSMPLIYSWLFGWKAFVGGK